jgi:hypothetical protein
MHEQNKNADWPLLARPLAKQTLLKRQFRQMMLGGKWSTKTQPLSISIRGLCGLIPARDCARVGGKEYAKSMRGSSMLNRMGGREEYAKRDEGGGRKMY